MWKLLLFIFIITVLTENTDIIVKNTDIITNLGQSSDTESDIHRQIRITHENALHQQGIKAIHDARDRRITVSGYVHQTILPLMKDGVEENATNEFIFDLKTFWGDRTHLREDIVNSLNTLGFKACIYQEYSEFYQYGTWGEYTARRPDPGWINHPSKIKINI